MAMIFMVRTDSVSP